MERGGEAITQRSKLVGRVVAIDSHARQDAGMGRKFLGENFPKNFHDPSFLDAARAIKSPARGGAGDVFTCLDGAVDVYAALVDLHFSMS